jgi:hypothetical protein
VRNVAQLVSNLYDMLVLGPRSSVLGADDSDSSLADIRQELGLNVDVDVKMESDFKGEEVVNRSTAVVVERKKQRNRGAIHQLLSIILNLRFLTRFLIG